MKRIFPERISDLLFAVRRFCQIVILVNCYGARYAWRSLRRAVLKRGPARRTILGEELASLCEALGPTFIKIGQILSSRSDLLQVEIVKPLSRLQEQVAPFDVGQIPGIIEDAFNRPIDDIFASFEFEPVSSASVAHVHRARLKDDREVAVKIRRPNIIRTVESDLRLLRFAARLLALLPFMRAMPFSELVDDIGAPVRQQLDFRLEAENNRLFRECFAGIEHIKFPRLVEELCTDSVLTMEFLRDLERVTSQKFTPVERKTAALAGLRALYRMIFLHGFIHADMHPGNVFMREWGEFVILDTGLVARLSTTDRQDFVNFFFGLVNNDGKECARIVYENALYRSKHCYRSAFEDAMVELIAEFSSKKSYEFEVAHFAYRLIETQRRAGIRGSTKFIMTILSMVVFDGICKQLYPACDFQAEARGFLISARYARKPTGVKEHLLSASLPQWSMIK
jgi:ubiquinone biosynthesis protein